MSSYLFAPMYYRHLACHRGQTGILHSLGPHLMDNVASFAGCVLLYITVDKSVSRTNKRRSRTEYFHFTPDEMMINEEQKKIQNKNNSLQLLQARRNLSLLSLGDQFCY